MGGVAIALALLASPATADTGIDFANVAFAPVTGPVSIPVGHAEFCRTHGAECGVNSQVVEAETLTEARWQQLVSVNSTYNASIVPETDEALYNVAEYWTYPDSAGDCEDFVLAKRRQLIEDGWNASALLMAVVRESNGNGHAVLMVRTDRGDLVLDNQDGRILLWNDTPYQFVKRQSQTNSAEWLGIADTHMMIVAAQN